MRSPSSSLRHARPLLGTLVEIRIDAGGDACALEAAFAAVAKVHRLMSAQEAASDVGRINRARPGEVLSVHPWTRRVLLRARELYNATRGLFDCCAAPGPQRASCVDLEILPGAVRLRRALRLTLDGIAKGFAVDQAVAQLHRAGVRSGAVNAGGDLRVFGADAQPVHVRDPANPSRVVLIGRFRDTAVATSALYFSRSRSSYIDPRSGRACLADGSATVIARDCMSADALTKPLLIDPEAAAPALRQLGAGALRLPCPELKAAA